MNQLFYFSIITVLHSNKLHEYIASVSSIKLSNKENVVISAYSKEEGAIDDDAWRTHANHRDTSECSCLSAFLIHLND